MLANTNELYFFLTKAQSQCTVWIHNPVLTFELIIVYQAAHSEL